MGGFAVSAERQLLAISLTRLASKCRLPAKVRLCVIAASGSAIGLRRSAGAAGHCLAWAGDEPRVVITGLIPPDRPL
jgi:hypothetical protein